MRIPVLPRDVAGRIITGSVSRMGWAVGAVTIVVTVPVLIETLAERGRVGDVALPLAMLVIMLAAIGVVAWRGTPLAVGIFLGVAGVACAVYQLALIAPDPEIRGTYQFLVNRPAVVLVMIGVVAATPWIGIAWTFLGYAVSWVVTIVVAVIVGIPIQQGVGPTLYLAIVVVGYLTLAGIQVAQRRAIPDFDELELETQRLAEGEDLARQTTAMIHDTVLNDLALVLNSPERLSAPARARLRDDLATLNDAEWLDGVDRESTVSAGEAEIRNDIMRIISEYQWRGLTVHMTVTPSTTHEVSHAASEAILGALRASFENVLLHSGATMAELEVVYSDTTVTVMVTDQGRGFDPAAIPEDRLGVRASIVDRIAAVGGKAQIWSAPGEGASVVMTVPVERVVPQDGERDGHAH